MEYDVIVLGSGPAGATAAMYLKKIYGKNVVLVDKAKFPRDKICGDAQGRKAANIMKELGIHDDYTRLEGHVVYGITLSSPNGSLVELDVADRNHPPPGYVHKRIVFDRYLHESAKKMEIPIISLNATDVIVENNTVCGIVGLNEKGEKEELRCKVLLAADGASSMVARKFGLSDNPREDFIVAVRAYYTGVTGMTDRIEIHLVESLLPGYFWIFPLPNGEANVGLGMIVKDMEERKINLREAMVKEIERNPLFKDRFKNAKLEGDIKGWSLPIASYHRKCYGNGFLLLGDAAGLIDPLSGEGIGTAMISAKHAAKIAAEAIDKGDCSEKFLKRYDKDLWDEIGPEIKANDRLQKLGKKHPELIDKLIMKSAKDESYRKMIEKMLPYTGGRHEMGELSFVEKLKLLKI
ncbi:MAG: geranylgeranyl reductase family protein [Candidatus Aenigmarchaeota archaeon]|nr:geranylgeranyl reductase family protein [Candidatus Aenigmarchaeota archaeon]